MKTISYFLLFCAMALCLPGWTKAKKSQGRDQIRVLLENNAKEALLEVKGPYYIYNPQDNSNIASGLIGKRFILRATASGLKWGQEFSGIHQIYIVPRKADASILVNGIQYQGNLLVYKTGNKINIVNEVDIESFIKSTLPCKLPQFYENEVMAAVAIAERTSAYYYAEKYAGSFYHIAADVARYQGCVLVTADSPASSAVDATRDLIMVGPEKKPFIACWTEHSAGKTAPYHTIFRTDEAAPQEGVEAPHAALDRAESKWSATFDRQQIAGEFAIGNLQSIGLFVDTFSNKAYALRLNDKENHADIDFFTLQEKLGKDKIKSNDLQVTLNSNEVVFSGYGRGHGVGICLYSASAMAQKGDMAVVILSRFFPKTYLLNLAAMPKNRKTGENL